MADGIQYAGSDDLMNRTATEAIEMERPVWEALRTIDGQTERLHEQLTALELRLAAVLGESEPRREPETTVGPAPVTSPFTERMRNQAALIGGAADRVAYLLERLDV